MQRIADHPRTDDLVDGDDIRKERVRVVLRVARRRDLDPRELLAGGAELVHVPLGDERVLAHRSGGAPQPLELPTRARCCHRRAYDRGRFAVCPPA